MRLLQIDFLRGMAILLVLFRHIPEIPEIHSSFLRIPLLFLKRMGWSGVDLFFVISGFLVSSLLFKELIKHKTISIKDFLIRRGLKIYPLFYLYILLVVFYFDQFENIELILSEVFFIQNYFGSFYPHTWSIAVEEHFYLLLPMVLFGLNKQNKLHWFPRIAVSISILCLIGRIITSIVIDQASLNAQFFPTHLRIDALFFGVLCAYYWIYKRDKLNLIINRKALSFLLAFLLYLPALLISPGEKYFLPVYGLSMLMIANGIILIAMMNINLNTNTITKLIALIGKYSYAIYLIHLPIAFIMTSHFSTTNTLHYFLILLLYFIGSCILGAVISKFIEYPILGLRNKWFPSRIN